MALVGRTVLEMTVTKSAPCAGEDVLEVPIAPDPTIADLERDGICAGMQPRVVLRVSAALEGE